jgi:hypothetical protein
MREHNLEANLKTVNHDWRETYISICAYGVDRCGVFMPPDTTLRLSGRKTKPTFETDVAFITAAPVRNGEPISFWQPLTTPIAYAESLKHDRFGRGPYGFLSWNFHDDIDVIGVLHSGGPDGDDDLDLWALKDQVEAKLRGRESKSLRGGSPDYRGVLRDMVLPHFYDPTNGARSSGDLVSIFTNSGGLFGTDGHIDQAWLAAPSEPLLGFMKDGWADGEAPPSALGVAATERSAPVIVPRAAWLCFHEAGIDLAKDYGEAGSDVWIEARGVIGRDFLPVINDGARWDNACETHLSNWKTQAPHWTKLIDRLRADESLRQRTQPDLVEVNRGTYYAMLPLVGKSLILAARSAHYRGAEDEAKDALASLKALLDFASSEVPPSDPWQRRVQEELRRLMQETGGQMQLPQSASL